MPSPSCPSPVIDQSHPQSAKNDNLFLGNAAETESEEEEEEQEEEEYAARLYLPVTHGKETFICLLLHTSKKSIIVNVSGQTTFNTDDIVMYLYLLYKSLKQ